MYVEQALVEGLERPREAAVPQARSRTVTALLWLQGCVLLALAQVLLAGYHFNIGNQTIQVPFLKKWIDPSLYPNDPTIDTIKDYPSFFFRGLAYPARYLGVERTYLLLHIAVAFLVLSGAYMMARTMFRDALAGAILITLLFAGHHHALAGDDLYSPAFTHTWAAFPIAIAALALLYRDWAWPAFALAGLLFNIHALTAAYLLAMMGLWAVWEIRRLGILKVAILFMTFALAATPTLREMVGNRQQFADSWINLTYLRSADHSFPSSWWQAGTDDIPRFALLVGLWAVSMSFPMRARQRRKTLLMAAAVGIMFLVGYVLADVRPMKVVLRAQLFRSSRLLMLIMFAHIAYAAACAVRMTLTQRKLRWRAAGVLEATSAIATVAVVALPPLTPYLPLALALALVVAILNGRLSWMQSAAVGVVALVVLLAWHRIEFGIPLLGRGWRIAAWPMANLGMPLWIGLGCGVGLWLVSRFSPGPIWRGMVLVQGIPVVALLGWSVYHTLLNADLRDNESLAWREVQEWARANTKPEDLFLTPPQSAKGGFRVYSERPVVCEWRDGTQMYFSGAFQDTWWKRLGAVNPEISLDKSGRRIVSRKMFESLPDAKLIELANAFGAKYIVLPKQTKRDLIAVAEDHSGRWVVYKPAVVKHEMIDSAPLAKPIAGADERRWYEQEEFIRRVAIPNIEKYRKGPVTIEIVNSSGQPVGGESYDVHLTNHAFKFGASLPFFMQVEGGNNSDYKPAPVDPRELARFLELFNYSVIPFSAKWMYLEPKEGDRRYEELDKYVDWCARNGVEIEFHFLSGLWPAWLANKPLATQGEMYRKHSKETVARYADRIKYWQVANDAYLLKFASTVVGDIRASYPNLRLGISDCTMFYAEALSGGRENRLYRGLSDVEDLASVGAKLDYYAPHGHSPHGLWPDPRHMYDSFDKFAEEGVRLHVTEFQVPLYEPQGRRGGGGPGIRRPGGGPAGAGRLGGGNAAAPATANLTPYRITGPVVRGNWDHEKRAMMFERFYTVCFSHPAVDAVNYWNFGPDSLEPGSGLLDEKFEPTPEFNKLKELIKERWTTKLSGKMPEDGTLAFRGFFGEYEIVLHGESGKPIKAKFTLSADRDQNVIKLVLDEQKGTLSPLK